MSQDPNVPTIPTIVCFSPSYAQYGMCFVRDLEGHDLIEPVLVFGTHDARSLEALKRGLPYAISPRAGVKRVLVDSLSVVQHWTKPREDGSGLPKAYPTGSLYRVTPYGSASERLYDIAEEATRLRIIFEQAGGRVGPDPTE